MQNDIDRIVESTGLCVPLAARILAMIEESGASQMEISTALSLVSHLRHFLKGSLVPGELAKSWSGSSAG